MGRPSAPQGSARASKTNRAKLPPAQMATRWATKRRQGRLELEVEEDIRQPPPDQQDGRDGERAGGSGEPGARLQPSERDVLAGLAEEGDRRGTEQGERVLAVQRDVAEAGRAGH